MPRDVGPRVLALVGATASGKTAVGEWVARRLSAEIVCADSRQVFRELSVGTGKPAPHELASQPHALFDALSVGQHASAGWYARAAGEACRDCLGRGRVPLLVGGSGLYLKALMTGLSAEPPREPARRTRLVEDAATHGVPALHARLRVLDPDAAARLHPTDRQRVIRALEVVESSGRPTSWWHAHAARPALEAEWCVVELTVAPPVLARRIDARTHAMFDGGLLDEARELTTAAREDALMALRAVGYDEAIELLAGRIDREEAETRTSQRTRQLAKRQRTWFRHQLEAERIDAESGDVEAIGARVLAAFTR